MVAACLFFGYNATPQNPGFNGAGFFENYTPQVEQWLKDLNTPFTLRVPGGAIAKFADPWTTPNRGWGLTYAGVDSILQLYSNADEENAGDAKAKWHRKTDAQPNYSYLDKLAELSTTFPGLQVIWVANIYIDPQITVNILEYLLINGVNVVCVEMGNESSIQVGNDFQKYKSKALPVRNAIKARWPNMPISHPASAATASRESNKSRVWNLALNAILNGDWVTFHLYYDGREFSGLKAPVNYEDALLQIADYNFDFDLIKAKFPNAGNFIVTEGNTQPAQLIGNTFLNAVFMYRFISEGLKSFEYMCLHNGVAPDIYGMIYGTPPRRNTWYYAYMAATRPNSFFTLDGSDGRDADFYTAENLTDSELFHGTGDLVPPVSFGNYLTDNGDTDTTCTTTIRQRITYVDSAGQIVVYKTDYIHYIDTSFISESDTLMRCDNHTLIDVYTSPVYTQKTDTVISIHFKDTIYSVPVVVYDTIIVCDTIAPPADTVQALDADTLIFNNEIEFRDFLHHYNLADYEVFPPKFDVQTDVEAALPYVTMTNNAGHRVRCISPDYYDVGINPTLHYLNDSLFAGKRCVIIFDHSGLAKSDREYRPEFCPDLKYRNCNLYITSPWTGQVAVFKNIFYWSDRNGNGVFNTNLKAWLLWGANKPEQTYSFNIDIWDKETGCDVTYKANVPGHVTAELRFYKMQSAYGFLRPK